MHIDARKLPGNSTIEGDICIIGAGAAGISMALDWVNTSYKVILLEGGGFDYDDQVQDLYAGKTTGQRYYPLRSARLHMFGGTTGHWAGMCAPFDDIDFEKRDYIEHSGWPITRADLDPYYARAHKLLELGPYNYDLKFWQEGYREYESMLEENDVVWNKIWQFSPPTRFGEKYRAPIVSAKNIHLYTFANVTDINATEDVNLIQSVTVKNHTGKQHTVKAKHYILACCSIQNSRLLLASNKIASKGLGNENDQVGRHFMEHLEINSAQLWLPHTKRYKLYEWPQERPSFRAELAITPQMQRKHGILNGTASLTPLSIMKALPEKMDVWQNEDPRKSVDTLLSVFRGAFDLMKTMKPDELYGAYELMTRIEQAPNPNSRVTLDSERDALNVPRAKLNWQLTSLDKRSIRKIYELIGQEFGRQGVGRVRIHEWLRDATDESWPTFTGGGWHHMGTTRMSDDPKHGVVDKNCKVHSIGNLFAAGASCYTTSAAPNPTLTLVSLTLRLSDHIKGLLKSNNGSVVRNSPGAAVPS
jgi:choline dehydrogenase-like flavoprotein